jgi:hypothetical protein
MAGRSHKPGRPRQSSLAKAPGICRQLTNAEVQHERLALAVDMVSLVLEEDQPLSPEMQQALRTIAGALRSVLDTSRALP